MRKSQNPENGARDGRGGLKALAQPLLLLHGPDRKPYPLRSALSFALFFELRHPTLLDYVTLGYLQPRSGVSDCFFVLFYFLSLKVFPHFFYFFACFSVLFLLFLIVFPTLL